MKTIFKQVITSAYPLNCIYYPFMNPFLNQFYNFPQKPFDFQFSTGTSDLIEEDNKKESKTEEYNSKVKTVIVLKKEKATKKKDRKLFVESSEKKSKGIIKKMVQKDSRNVMSNLLRIFLKNLLEVRFYDRVIEDSLKNLHISVSLQEFIDWALSFRINFKNYIRINQVKKMFADRKDLRKVMGTILLRFLSSFGVSHCLTSKRIERSGWQIHLSGIRELSVETRKWLTQ